VQVSHLNRRAARAQDMVNTLTFGTTAGGGCRTGRIIGGYAMSSLLQRPGLGRRVYSDAKPIKLWRRRHLPDLQRGMQRPSDFGVVDPSTVSTSQARQRSTAPTGDVFSVQILKRGVRIQGLEFIKSRLNRF
jgi:hypothetical protein